MIKTQNIDDNSEILGKLCFCISLQSELMYIGISDLRQFTFCIKYGEKQMTTTRWPVRLNKGTSGANFCFGDAYSAYYFQRLITGMRVCADL